MALLPCPSCRRHVRVGEASCPFCRTTLDAARKAPSVALPPKRLTRAGVFLFASVSVAGCGGKDEGGVVPVYGAPIDSSALDADANDTSLHPLYGDAPPLDSGTADTASDATDAGADAKDTSGAALYGAAPFR